MSSAAMKPTDAASPSTSRSARKFGVFISGIGNGQRRDGTPEHPYSSLDEALSSLAEQISSPNSESDSPLAAATIEIVSLPQPGSPPHSSQRPRHEFFIDPQSSAVADANGTAARPWPDLRRAIEALADLRRQGGLAIGAGDHVRVNMRAMFSSTPLDRKKRRAEWIAKSIFFCMTMALVLPVIGILSYLFMKAWPALSLSFLLQNPRNGMTAGGIWAPLVGTFYLVFISLMVAAPIGVLAGVYLNEYARDNWFTRVVNLAVVNLAGVPSIVHALFGVGAFVLFARMGESVLAASCTLAIMTLPVIITSTKEALSSVPRSFREACWNMGASRWQTIRTIVLPNSISGILTGVILQVSRAAGETAPILFTGAAFSVPGVPNQGLGSFFPYGLHDRCMALSYHLMTVLMNVRPPSQAAIDAGRSLPIEYIQYGTAVVLIGLVLTVNSFSIGLRMYLRSRKKW